MKNIQKSNQEALDYLKRAKENSVSEEIIQDLKENNQQFLEKQKEEDTDLTKISSEKIGDEKKCPENKKTHIKKQYAVLGLLFFIGAGLGFLIGYILYLRSVDNSPADTRLLLQGDKVKYISSYYMREAHSCKECLDNLAYFPLDINIDSLNYNLPYYPAILRSKYGKGIDPDVFAYKDLLKPEKVNFFWEIEPFYNDSTDSLRIEDGRMLFEFSECDDFFVSVSVTWKHEISKKVVTVDYRVPTVYWNCIRPIIDRQEDFVFKSFLLKDAIVKCSFMDTVEGDDYRVNYSDYIAFCVPQGEYIETIRFKYLSFEEERMKQYYDAIPIPKLDEPAVNKLVELDSRVCPIPEKSDNLLAYLENYLKNYDKNDVVKYFMRNIGEIVDIWKNEKINRRLYKLLGSDEANRIEKMSVTSSIKRDPNNQQILFVFCCQPHSCNDDNATISINTQTGKLSVHVDCYDEISNYTEFY